MVTKKKTRDRSYTFRLTGEEREQLKKEVKLTIYELNKNAAFGDPRWSEGNVILKAAMVGLEVMRDQSKKSSGRK